MKTVCIVQARMGSERLPGKVLLPLNGHSVIGEVLDRCKRIPGVDEVVCTIPENSGPEDTVYRVRNDALARVAIQHATISCGPEHDVLARYYEAAKNAHADIIVRITGDCPLISPELCGEVLAALKRTNSDYASNVHPRTFPKGMDCEAFTYRALYRAQHEAEPSQREHVTTWMLTADIKRTNVRSPWPMDGRITLDTEDDYRVICAAFGHEPYRHLYDY